MVPFRQRHPDYQRHYRLLREIREIRDEMDAVVHRLAPRLQRLFIRMQALLAAAAKSRNASLSERRPRSRTVRLANRVKAALDTLERLLELLDDVDDSKTRGRK